MKNPFKIIFPVIIISFFFSSCYYDVEEDLYPTTDCATDGITYSDDILPLIENNCYTCHNEAASFANINIEGYDNLMVYVNSGQFLGSIKHQPAYSPMPQGQPPLVECNIEKIEAWINAGAPNN